MGFKIAAIQMNSQNDKGQNLAKAEQLIDEAARAGANLVALPEAFNMLGTNEDILNGAETIAGETAQFLGKKAKQHNIYLHGGSIPLKGAGENRVSNTTLVYDPQGVLLAQYSKIHLFDIHLDGQPQYWESATVDAGNQLTTFETTAGNFGLSICYDIRFPELFRALTLSGARVVFLPAAFTLYTGKDHWEPLIRARAIENQIFMVAPAQIGSHPPDKQCYGNGMIVDPWGTVLARAPERECVIFADIDFTAQDKVRAELPALTHRRPDLY